MKTLRYAALALASIVPTLSWAAAESVFFVSTWQEAHLDVFVTDNMQQADCVVVEEPEDFRAHRLVHRVGTWQESHKTIFVTTDATKASPEGCLDSWR